jgi:TPR repeat protein
MFVKQLLEVALVPLLLTFSLQTCPQAYEPDSALQPMTSELMEEYCKRIEEEKDLDRVYLIPDDPLEALSEEELADKALKGDAEAQCRLGRKLQLFKGGDEWKEWLEKAAAQGHLDAHYHLGVILLKRGEEEGANWLEKAGAKGDLDAKYKLGRAYYLGTGVPKDYARAVEYFQDLANRGDPDGQCQLGVMYYEGKGVPQDYVLAHRWINLAASQASNDEGESIRRLRDFLAKDMTSQQIAEAQESARNWKPR